MKLRSDWVPVGTLGTRGGELAPSLAQAGGDDP
jgi:hypothetical protein